jgi:transposase
LIRRLTASCYVEGKGRPSIDPVVYFRMVLVAYLYGIDSDRRLCEDVYCHLAYRWFCRLSLEDKVPDHSSFTKIRDRYGEEIHEQVFTEIVKLCQQHGLVAEECSVMTDATLIPADASLNSLTHNDTEEADKEAESQQRDRGLKDGSSARRVSNKTHTSRTDPDATLAQKRGTPRQLKYKVHQTIDADNRVILDTHVTTGARHDNQPCLQQLQRIEERYRLTIVEATADRGYGSAAIIRTLQEHGRRTLIPLWSGRVGSSKHLKSGLIYERKQDCFRCPEGKYLTPNPSLDKNYKRYASSSADCQVCSQALTCTARIRGSSPQRFVLRSLDQALFEEVLTRMRDPVFRQKMSERMWKSEGLFAEAKQNHGLSRARYRGRAKVQIQAYLSATAQNLKRLVKDIVCWLLIWLSNRQNSTTQLA